MARTPQHPRVTRAQVNSRIAKYGVELVKGDCYFYFAALSNDTPAGLEDAIRSVYSNTIDCMSLDSWVEHVEEAVAKYRADRADDEGHDDEGHDDEGHDDEGHKVKSSVWVLSANAVSDVSGELLDGGGVIGVYSTEAKAEAALKAIPEGYMRSHSDYSIDEKEIDA